jgi:hypothetical protein
MEIDKALSQISEIHEHLTRGEICRDYRSGPMASTGVLALLAAAFQTRAIGEAPAYAFIAYWAAVATLGATLAGAGVLRGYLVQAQPLARRRTRTVVGQLLPPVAAGMLATAGLAIFDANLIALLPGLWAIFFSLGIFAARPYLPRMIGWVALYYLVAGGILLALARTGASLSPWGMGLAFGPGQLFAGFVLYWNLEKPHIE